MVPATLPRPFAPAALVAAALLLAACGGGGDSTPPPAASAFPPSSTLANACTVAGEQKFVRSLLDEIYLWNDEIAPVNAPSFATVPSYFSALLVKTPDANGLPRDRFSAVLTTSAANALQTTPGAVLGAAPAFLPAAAGKAVSLASTVSSPKGRKVGYIQFDDHNQGAQDELIAAFAGLRAGGVDELVLDMRHNTGGYLYVAQAVASMVTGPQNEGRVFEQLRYNARRQAESAASTYYFSGVVQTAEAVHPRGAALPQLNLPRLYVLASGQTCSASESIVNSLRGIDVEVVLVGGTTCGKPFGFHRHDNCGLAFFAIEFQSYNAKNSGDYTAGLKPTCPVAGNAAPVLGDPAEPLLAAALHHIDTGSCPAAPASRVLSQQGPQDGAPRTVRQPWEGRLLK